MPCKVILSSLNTIPNDKRVVVKFSGLKLTKSQSNKFKIQVSQEVTYSHVKLALLDTALKLRMKGMLSSISSYLEASMSKVTPYK